MHELYFDTGSPKYIWLYEGLSKDHAKVALGKK
jgi:hypothetical protein